MIVMMILFEHMIEMMFYSNIPTASSLTTDVKTNIKYIVSDALSHYTRVIQID
jgi:hypothetical protein